MKIKNVEMVMSAVSKAQYPSEGLPQIAFVGRSNVGKSSLINTLLGRRKIARVSQTPGKTRTINFYEVNKEFYFTDLPGYGYAKLSKQEKSGWGQIMVEYFIHSRDLKHVFVLVDIRHTPKPEDVSMVDYVRYYNIPLSIIATKADKLTRSNQMRAIQDISKTLKVSKEDIFMISSLKKTGQEEVLEEVEKILAEQKE